MNKMIQYATFKNQLISMMNKVVVQYNQIIINFQR